MRRFKLISKYILAAFLMLVVLDALFMLLGALLIEKGWLAMEGAEVWTLICLVSASFAASLFCGNCSGVSMTAYCTAVFSFLIFALFPIMFHVSNLNFAASVKVFTALICGAFLGNFWGIRRYYKLRKTGNKKRSYTK